MSQWSVSSCLQVAAHLERLLELGFIDEVQNRKVLEESQGSITMAIEKLLAAHGGLW